MSSFLGFDYQLTINSRSSSIESLRPRDGEDACMQPTPSLILCEPLGHEVDALVEEMHKVADACVWDARATAQHTISSMYRRYDTAPQTAGEPPFAFALPDHELNAHPEPQGFQPGELNMVLSGRGDRKAVKSAVQKLAEHIVELKRAGKDREAIELLMGSGGRIIEGFGQVGVK